MVKYRAPQELDAVFGALSDPLRRQLIDELRQGDRTVSQLHATTDVSLVAVLKHIEVMEGAGLIQTDKRGRSRLCRFRPEGLAVAETWLAATRSFWTQALLQLDDHLKEDNS